MIIKEEGLEPFADQASSDSGQFKDDLGQDDDDDPDYQVDFITFILCVILSVFKVFIVCLFFTLYLSVYVPLYYVKN